jgi:hypothetical protein
LKRRGAAIYYFRSHERSYAHPDWRRFVAI